MATSLRVTHRLPSATTKKPKVPAPRPSISASIELENIEALRLREGIVDVQLRKLIQGLAKGDHVNLTFLTGSANSETWRVRITSIRGPILRGKLVSAGRDGRSALRAGDAVVFRTAHIHSLTKRG